ncbi:MAG TPA: hypothetical protein VL131_10050 [Gammaproteobacteria bacterium]|jgi:hypothetical protein|nr:hypothetical protein [Gammaproteobacteria bacterium]
MPTDEITTDNLGDHIFDAAKEAFGKKFNKVKAFVQAESDKLAITLNMIIDATAKGQITEAEAHILLNQQKVAASAVFTAAEGMTVVAAQAAIDAGLAVVKNFVNGKLGFELI